MSRILQQLDKFLDEHYQPGVPVLLGFSGGPDSTAMLHALYGLQRKYSLEIRAIHVDHAWRDESHEEARILKEEVEKLGIRCDVVRLSKEDSYANREERAREARIDIFRTYYYKYNAQALILAHQAGDQAETILKRIFEGGHISALGGMRLKAMIDEIVIWRPFLMTPKKELIQFCQERTIPYLNDYTNQDQRYLRARLRAEILPKMEECFGKAIEENLCRLAESSQEIADYMTMKVQSLLKTAVQTREGISIDLATCHPLEAQFVIRQLSLNERVMLGQQHLRHLVQLIQSGVSNRSFSMGKRKYLINKGQLTLVSLLTHNELEKENFSKLIH